MNRLIAALKCQMWENMTVHGKVVKVLLLAKGKHKFTLIVEL